jgi:hypothetical protein
MQDFLTKIKLINHFTMELQMNKQTFVSRLSAITDEGSTGLFSNPFEVFSSNKKAYKGHVAFDEFSIEKQRLAFRASYDFTIAKGVLTENNGRLTIETEVRGFNNYMLFYYILLIVVYSAFIVFVIGSGGKAPLFVVPFIALHGALMFAIPYFMMKRGVERMIYDLEREFFYLTKND